MKELLKQALVPLLRAVNVVLAWIIGKIYREPEEEDV